MEFNNVFILSEIMTICILSIFQNIDVKYYVLINTEL